MQRSSDIPARETELDKSMDEFAQWMVEGALPCAADWRKPFHANRGRCWAAVMRNKPVPGPARAAA